ncbi:MAG: MaoC family dehydratase [Desulfobacca sp.]|nr:MaoC family dehydratase [Desulfobacca sp.]
MNHSIKGKRLADFSYLIDRSKIKEMAEAIKDPNPLYREAAAAQEAGYSTIIAPPTFGTSINLCGGPGFHELCEGLGADPLRVLHAEQEYEYFKIIYPGDMVRVTIDVADIYSKDGRMGTMQFALLETTVTNQEGEKVLVGRSTILEKPLS